MKRIDRRMFAVLALAIGIGLWQPAMAQQDDGEENATPASLMKMLEDALEELRTLEALVRALRAQVDEEGRKTLVPRIPTGLSRSTDTPVYSKEEGDSETDPGLAELLPDSDIRFPALSAALARDFSNSRVSLSDDAWIKSVSSDGANGFHVTYVIGEVEETVHFAAGDYGAGTSATGYYKEADGKRYWLWSYTGSIAGAQKNMGSTEFRYFDAMGTEQNVDGVSSRNYVTYGPRTDAGALPAGSAHYSGRMYADLYESDFPSNSDRTRVRGSLRLTVDFGAGSVTGDIRRWRILAPGQTWETLPATEYADISDGRIVDGQFTAAWTQVNPGAAAGEIFAGDLLGEFYGPNAEEVGGVLNGANDDQVIAGWFGGIRPTPSVPTGDLALTSTASHQDLVNSTTTDSDAAVTAIAGDGADGFDLTYTIGSDTHRVQLGADDFGGDPRWRTTYHETVGDRRFYLYDASRSFTANPEFSHFNVNGWTVTNVAADGSASDFHTGYVVYGAATDASSMPTGTANYAGRMYTARQPSDAAGSANRVRVRGDLTMSADFDAGTVGGSFDNLEFIPPGGSWQPATSTRTLFIENGSIAGNALAADVTFPNVFDGNMEGHFFGPGAAEVGGTIEGTALTDNAVVYGYFGGRKQ